MRTKLLLLALSGLLLRTASASPFLICDAVPANPNQGLNIVSYVVTGLSANALTVPAQINADGSQQLHYDVGTLANGSYTVAASAVNGFGKEGPSSSPFTFTVGLPGTPTGLRLSPT